MYTRDYILRMIEQLQRAIATILGQRDRGAYEEALDTLGDTYDELLGHPPHALAALTLDSAAMTLGKWPRIRIYARLLSVEAEVLSTRGRPGDDAQAVKLRQRALAMILRGLRYGGQGDPALADDARALLGVVDAATLDRSSLDILRGLGLL